MPGEDITRLDEQLDRPAVHELEYEDVNISYTVDFKPAITIGALAMVAFLLLGGILPSQRGADGITMFTYTSVIWALVILVLAISFEYWVLKREERRDESRAEPATERRTETLIKGEPETTVEGRTESVTGGRADSTGEDRGQPAGEDK